MAGMFKLFLVEIQPAEAAGIDHAPDYMKTRVYIAAESIFQAAGRAQLYAQAEKLKRPRFTIAELVEDFVFAAASQ